MSQLEDTLSLPQLLPVDLESGDLLPVYDLSTQVPKQITVKGLVSQVIQALADDGLIPLSKLNQTTGSLSGARLTAGTVQQNALAPSVSTGISSASIEPPLTGGVSENNLSVGLPSNTPSFQVLAGPSTGSSGQATFRPLVGNDLPLIPAEKITGTLPVGAIPAIDARSITAGLMDQARIPDLDADKIASGVLNANRIPNIPTGKIIGGTLDLSTIPNLPASKINSGVFSVSQIPPLSATILQSGTLDTARIAPNSIGGSKLGDGSTLVAEASDPISPGLYSGQRHINYTSGREHFWNGSTWFGIPAFPLQITTISSSTILNSSHADSLIWVDSPSPVTITVPDGTSIFPIPTQILICQGGSGQVTVVAQSGLAPLISSGGRYKTAQLYSVISLIKVSYTGWLLMGERAA